MPSQTAPTTTHIIVRSPDTDVLVSILKYARHIDPVSLFGTGTGSKRRLLSVKHIVEGSDYCLALTALHCFTGCDTIRAFSRRGKITPLKVLEKFPEFMDVFDGLGGNIKSSAKLLDDLERFVCCMYGKAQFSSVNKFRYDSFSQKYQGASGQVLSAFAGMDLSLLPRCTAALDMHAQRANYQAYIWCHAHTNSFQTYQALMVIVGKSMKKVPLITNGVVVLLFRRS